MIVSLSGIIIPLILFIILLYGMISKKEMYQPFLEGVQDGFKVVIECPYPDCTVFSCADFQDVRSAGSSCICIESGGTAFKDS